MPIFQIVFIGTILVALLMAIFILAWYVALPLLLLWGLLGGIRWLKDQWYTYHLYRDANGCTIRKTPVRRHKTEDAIIDVDYTEVK